MSLLPDIYDDETSQLEEEQRTLYWGKYRGFVRDRNDPEKRGRIRVFCPPVMGEVDDSDHWLGFAEPCFPVGGEFDIGGFPRIPGIDAGIWLEFEQGDVDHPIWVGCWVAGTSALGVGDVVNGVPVQGEDESEVARLARGIRDESSLGPKGTDIAQTQSIDIEQGTLVDGPAFNEPVSPYAASYPENHVIKTASGHVIELDDTPGSERIHIYHRSGHYYEISSDGNLAHKTTGKRHDIIQGTHIRHSGADIVVVDGTVGETIGGLVSRVFLDDVTQLYSKLVRDFFLADVAQNFKSDWNREVGGSLNTTVNANYSMNVIGNGTVLFSGPYDFVTLETLAFTMGNTGGADFALFMSAVLGGMKFDTNEGNIEFDTLIGDIKASTVSGNVEIEAGSAVGGGDMLLKSSKAVVESGEVFIGGETGAEPFMLGDKTVAFIKNLVVTELTTHNHLASVLIPGPPSPTSPPVKPFTPPQGLLSESNKVT